MRPKMMAKRTTAVSLKRSCDHQRALRNFLKHAFTCQIPQLYIDQVPRRSTHKPLSYWRDGQTDRQTDGRTDVISALYRFQGYTISFLEGLCLTFSKLGNSSPHLPPLLTNLNCTLLNYLVTRALNLLVLPRVRS